MMNGKTETIEVKSFREFLRFIRTELKPKGKIFTAFNVISAPIIFLGAVLIVYRLAKGLGSPITHLSQTFPWGIWIGFDVMVGVAFAGGAYVLTFIVYILNSEKYHPIIRATVLNGFLAYVFYAGAIFLDCGRWWNILNPIIGNEFGVNSVLFLVAWHFLLYMLAELVEFSPAIAEWLGSKKNQENSQFTYLRSSDIWYYSIDSPSIRSRGISNDGKSENSSFMVHRVYSCTLFCFQYFRRTLHGNIRRNSKP